MSSDFLLPENHRRSLSVTAKMIEEGLDDVELKLKGNCNHKITQIIEPSYDIETKEKIYEILKDIKTLNTEMFNELSLTPQKTYESRILNSQAVYLWSILIDSSSKKLERYGKLNQQESQKIDFYIFKILKLLEKLKEFN